MESYTEDYLLDKQVKIFQPVNGYRASSDAVILSSMIKEVKPSETILDIGSGTGAISLCLARRFPHTEITGLELQPELAELSNQSAAANKFEKLKFINCDIRKPLTNIFNCSFHHVITNPPYAEKDMPSPNIGKALAHNHQNFSLTEWLVFALKMLRPQGRLYMINRAEALAETLAALYGKAGDIHLIPLYSKEGQNAKRILLSARKNSKAPLIIHPGIVIHDSDSRYTPIANRLLRQGLPLPD